MNQSLTTTYNTRNAAWGNDNMDYYVSGSFLEDPSYVIMSG